MTTTAYDDQFAECKVGWYWVKVTAKWEPAYFDGLEFTLDHGPIAKLGSRIPTPDESWQCVPIEPTMKMRQSAGLGAHQELRMWKAWDAMLSAAPKPEDV